MAGWQGSGGFLRTLLPIGSYHLGFSAGVDVLIEGAAFWRSFGTPGYWVVIRGAENSLYAFDLPGAHVRALLLFLCLAMFMFASHFLKTEQ